MILSNARQRLHTILWQHSFSRNSYSTQRLICSSAKHFERSLQPLGFSRAVVRDQVFPGLKCQLQTFGLQKRQGQTRSFFSFRPSASATSSGSSAVQHLKALEQKANSNPMKAKAQLQFLQELNKNYPALVLRRFEETEFIKSEAINKEYMKALVNTQQLDAVPIKNLVQSLASGTAAAGDRSSSSSYSSSYANTGASAAAAARSKSTPDHPVFVQMVDGGFKPQLWKLARSIAIAFIVISSITAVADEQGLTKSLGGMGQGKSTINMATGSDKRFSDVKGVDEAKEELEEIVHYLQNPDKFTRLGGKLPKGVMLTGPPGTGKTLLARAIAGEAGVPFFYASGSDFEEMYVGVGARRVRELFQEAKKKAPCIVFLDEIDAIGGTRKSKDSSAMKQTLNQLLTELDGFEQNNGIMIVGATNFPEVLDKALIRPGRFDRHISVPLPDILGRRQILELHTRASPLNADVNLDRLARATPGMSGADLCNLVNEAAIKACVLERPDISMACLEYAKDKILMGSERKSAVISPESAKLTAYHEGGHALVALRTPGADPVYKATIMPRGQALGMVSQLPEGDQTSISRKQLLAKLDVCMGGRVAEELVFGAEEVSGGASSDIQYATQIAEAMVTKYGMSETVGRVYHDISSSSVNHHSSRTKEVIDVEIRNLCEASYGRAKAILTKHQGELEIVAQGLLDHETLTGSEIQDLLKGKTLSKQKI